MGVGWGKRPLSERLFTSHLLPDLAASVGAVGVLASCGTGGEREANAGKEVRGAPIRSLFWPWVLYIARERVALVVPLPSLGAEVLTAFSMT